MKLLGLFKINVSIARSKTHLLLLAVTYLALAHRLLLLDTGVLAGLLALVAAALLLLNWSIGDGVHLRLALSCALLIALRLKWGHLFGQIETNTVIQKGSFRYFYELWFATYLALLLRDLLLNTGLLALVLALRHALSGSRGSRLVARGARSLALLLTLRLARGSGLRSVALLGAWLLARWLTLRCGDLSRRGFSHEGETGDYLDLDGVLLDGSGATARWGSCLLLARAGWGGLSRSAGALGLSLLGAAALSLLSKDVTLEGWKIFEKKANFWWMFFNNW